VLHPEGLLDLAARLNGGVPPAVLVSVTIGETGFGSELSPKVEAALLPATEAARSALVQLDHRNVCAATTVNR
jgi:hypothetical protein